MAALGLVTLYMAYQAQFLNWSHDMTNLVPEEDPDQAYFKQFKQTFGEDGNIMALGFRDSSIYEVDNFRKMKYLTVALGGIKGVKDVLGLPNLKMLQKNTAQKKFDLISVFPEMPQSQQEIDSVLNFVKSLKFYSGQLLNEANGATLILITVERGALNSEYRHKMIADIVMAGDQFGEKTGIEVNYAGLPYIRSVNILKIKEELNKFLIFSLLVTGIILLAFFRSCKAVLFPLVIIGVVVVWVMGTISLFQYKVTLLTGLIPSIIVVIGIPNSVYMLNKYHHEYSVHGNQMDALGKCIKNIGIITFITNFTTAIGFFVLVSTGIPIMMEFGIIAGLNIMCTFIVSTLLIPSMFSFCKPPSRRHLKHLDFRILNRVLAGMDVLVHKYRPLIFTATIVLVVLSAYGISRLHSVSYMVDDLPEDSPMARQLAFFEENFSGVMPLELIVDTGVKQGIRKPGNLGRINEFEEFLDSLEGISQPISVISFIKAAKQAFYNHDESFYSIPKGRETPQILRYLKAGEDKSGLTKSFMDSTGRVIRISLKMPDIGSKKMDSLVARVISPKIEEIFGGTDMEVHITGTVPLFVKGNKYLIDNLVTSMVFAFIIIAVIMALLFRNIRMIVISLLPNMLPLIFTAAIMGFFGVPLKPSTVLIFSIAFGISVDDSLHFLAKYRQELHIHRHFVPVAVSRSLKETGSSMIYTSVILFFGFIIFTLSEFGGTIALGKLTSITLLFAMFTNLIVLPALLLQFDTGKFKKERLKK